MTFNKYFDEKIITIRCVVLEISYFEKSLEIEVITPFTAIGRNMIAQKSKSLKIMKYEDFMQFQDV